VFNSKKSSNKDIDESQLSHTTYNCLYHIVFIPKYRRNAIYGKLRRDIGIIIRRLCEYKEVEIIEAHAMPNHIHMLVKIPPKISVSQFMGYLKGKSALMIFENHANLKYKYGQRTFWARGYYVSTVGLNKNTIKKYIREQEVEDMLQDKRSVKEYEDPFKGC
jgi:putative transposase